MNTYSLKQCQPTDLPAILQLQEIIFSQLSDPSWLRYNTADTFQKCLNNPNITIGIFEKDELIALGIAVDAHGTPEDLCADLKTCSPTQGANLKLILVHPSYRGQGMQKKLIRELENRMSSRGYTHLAATISPDNIYSRNNFVSCGYHYDHSAMKYNGLQRDVYVRAISSLKDTKSMINP